MILDLPEAEGKPLSVPLCHLARVVAQIVATYDGLFYASG